MVKYRNVKDVFNDWAQDYHADGMEKGHWQSVKEAFKMIPESKGNYLELGFGNGYGLKYMATHQYKNGKCYGLDISFKMVEKAQNKITDLSNVNLDSGNFLEWNAPQNIKFSCVFSMEVFYYFDDVQRGIEKGRSLLEPGGQLIVLVNRYFENIESHSWDKELNTSMALWSAQQYYDGFRNAGLSEVKQIFLNQKKNHPGTLCTIGIK